MVLNVEKQRLSKFLFVNQPANLPLSAKYKLNGNTNATAKPGRDREMDRLVVQ